MVVAESNAGYRLAKIAKGRPLRFVTVAWQASKLSLSWKNEPVRLLFSHPVV
jgi:hypothetical protein